jgi:hypothetical protein
MVLPILQRARGFRPALNSRERTFLQQLESSVDRALAAGIALTPLQSDIRDARSVRRRKYAVAGFAIVAVLAIVALTVVDYGADQSPTAGRVEAEAGSVAQKEAGADGRAIEVGGKSIRVGDTADEVFEKLQPRTSHRRISEPDPRRPGSLIVRHVYALEGQDWEFTFARQADPGPYRLVSIASAPEAESSGIPYADPTAAAAIDRSSMDPRQHYQVTVLGFDAVSGYDGGTTDFLRLKITNGSQVTLPTLTVRTNRWSQGTNVGWSRAPPIDVSDLKPGYSKTVDYYPRGHLGAFALDGLTIDSMTVEIEETIASDSRRFFPELETAEMAQREAEQARRAEEAREIVNTALAEQSHEARKEAAWNAFYVPSKVCENPPDMDTQVECGNAHIRAKKDFEKKWSRGLIK